MPDQSKTNISAELKTDAQKVNLSNLVSPLARKVIKCLKDYNGIAETGNIQYELGMTGRMIANIMRPLIKKGIIKILGRGCNMETEFGGSTYMLTGKLPNGMQLSRRTQLEGT